MRDCCTLTNASLGAKPSERRPHEPPSNDLDNEQLTINPGVRVEKLWAVAYDVTDLRKIV
jgi:hypothetical protein